MNDKSKRFIQNFYTMVENQFQTKIRILRSNNETEYFNQVLGNFLQEKGIQHQSTFFLYINKHRIHSKKAKKPQSIQEVYMATKALQAKRTKNSPPLNWRLTTPRIL